MPGRWSQIIRLDPDGQEGAHHKKTGELVAGVDGQKFRREGAGGKDLAGELDGEDKAQPDPET